MIFMRAYFFFIFRPRNESLRSDEIKSNIIVNYLTVNLEKTFNFHVI